GLFLFLFMMIDLTPSCPTEPLCVNKLNTWFHFTDLQIIKVTEGSDVILPCSTSTEEDVTSQSIEWKKDGQKVFLYEVRTSGRTSSPLIKPHLESFSLHQTQLMFLSRYRFHHFVVLFSI
uniref:Immunoglobulin V-set domain-containing protein n=1 Tax=Anabas testudineus TaxID=64144 RepID=A0A3Q1J784_ANATE